MILFFGLTGSGKSTQGRMLAQALGWQWLSVGEILRNSNRFTEQLQAGELVDDNQVIQLMADKIDHTGTNIILDGYPRDMVQAEWLANHLIDRIDLAIYLTVPKEELLHRLLLRGRADDNQETILKRFSITEQNIYSILDLLSTHNITIHNIDGTGTVEAVTARVLDAVRNSSLSNQLHRD